MAKSKRTFSTGIGGGERPDQRARTYRSPNAPPRPPAPAARGPIAPPRPLTPAGERTGSPGRFAALGTDRIVVSFGALAIVIALGLVGYGWYHQSLQPRRALAVSAGDRSYSMEYFARRYRDMIENPPQDLNVRSDAFTKIPQRVEQNIESEAIYLQRAADLGVGAESDAIDRKLLELINYPVPASSPPAENGAADAAPEPLRNSPAIEAAVRRDLRRTGLTLAEMRDIAAAAVLKDRLANYFTAQTPTRGPQVRLQLLQFPTESDAKTAIDLIKSGANTFADLAENKSLDQAGKSKGGQRDWAPKGIYPANIEAQAFSLPVNTLSGPLDGGAENGWFVIQVNERSDDRELTEEARKELAQKASSAWYKDQHDALKVKNDLTDKKIRWAFTWSKPKLDNLSAGGTGQSLPGGASLPVAPQPPAPGSLAPGQTGQNGAPAAPAPAAAP